MNKFLEDDIGNKSSKRLWGSVLLSVGIVFSIIAFWCSVTTGLADSSMATKIIESFLISGGALLGINIFDRKVVRRYSHRIKKEISEDEIKDNKKTQGRRAKGS